MLDRYFERESIEVADWRWLVCGDESLLHALLAKQTHSDRGLPLSQNIVWYTILIIVVVYSCPASESSSGVSLEESFLKEMLSI
jgi:hypothetical protein